MTDAERNREYLRTHVDHEKIREFIAKYELRRVPVYPRVPPRKCPDRPHRGPEGPNEDLGQCPRCWSPTFAMRPEGETFGYHLPDCSLPIRHESYCQPGGDGHPPARKIRG